MIKQSNWFSKGHILSTGTFDFGLFYVQNRFGKVEGAAADNVIIVGLGAVWAVSAVAMNWCGVWRNVGLNAPFDQNTTNGITCAKRTD